MESLFPQGIAHYLAGGLLIGAAVALLYLVVGLIGGASTVFTSTWSYVSSLPHFRQPRIVGSRDWRLVYAAGMLIGGALAARAARLERLIGICLAGSAALLVLVGSGWLPGTLAMAVASLAGFGTGLAGPSRDMLIRRASPPGATGRVYGTVYSGLDIGFALAAPVFGAVLDAGSTGGVFHGAAFALGCGVACASLVGLRLAATRRVAA
jgi:hypothetical protein